MKAISSIDDLLDERGQAIVREFNLSLSEVIPNFESVDDELATGEITCDGYFPEQESKRFASAALVCFELTKREYYPYKRREGEQLLCYSRDKPQSFYEDFGMSMLALARQVKNHRCPDVGYG